MNINLTEGYDLRSISAVKLDITPEEFARLKGVTFGMLPVAHPTEQRVCDPIESDSSSKGEPPFCVVIDSQKTFEALGDVHSHYNSWRNALVEMRDAAHEALDKDNESYWEHELRAFDRTFTQLHTIPLPSNV